MWTIPTAFVFRDTDSEFLSGVAYLGIPIMLVLFVWKRRDRSFDWLFLWFAASIATTGVAELLDASAAWVPVQPWLGVARVLSAAAAVATAVLTVLALPGMLALPDRAVLSTENLALRNGIHDSERRFSEVADAAPARIWMTNAEGLLIYCNVQTETFYGIPRSELLGLNAPPRVHPEDFESCFRLWLDAFRKRIPIQVEFRQLRADNEWRWTNAHVVPRFSPNGAFLGYIGIMVDVTERRQVEAELIAAKKAAEDASRAKDDFIAALSHELRTPLTPALMTATSMELDETLAPEMRRQWGLIRHDIELEVRLIDDLLDLARIVRGKLSVRPEYANIDSLLTKSIEIVREESVRKQIALYFEPTATITTIHADPARLEQVFWNLLKNAIKFTPAHGNVHVRTFNPDLTSLSIEIRDTGIGIAAEHIASIFRPFEQAAATGDRRYGGLGLGLAIAKTIVELHHGTISVASPGPQRGTSFTVQLPIAEVRHQPVPRPAAAPAPCGAPLHILLVEDDEQTREVLVRILSRDGHEVQPAESCAAAFEALLAHTSNDPFQVLISDLGLPDGNGLSLVQQIKSQYPLLTAIALSGYGTDEDIQHSLQAGFRVHLTKPVGIEALRRALAA